MALGRRASNIAAVNTLDLARSQFGITTLFHFIFVPMSIGLACFVALCQTLHYRTGNEIYLRMTRFWGKFMLISLAIGVVTGIVQEFQFGMNWSIYSRYVGDIFGAPLAMEGLLAFFLESTFLGLWIFGWGRLSPKVHLATVWLMAFGTVLSAYFILAANSWMQHPVGYTLNTVTHRAELTNIFSVLTNSTVLLAFPHTIFGALSTGAMLVIGISGFNLLRKRNVEFFTRSLRLVLPIALVTILATLAFGDSQARLMAKQEPMKMAAAEGLEHTTNGAGLSIFAMGPLQKHPLTLQPDIRIPHLESLIATLHWNGSLPGVLNVQAQEVAKYGPGDYIPILGVTYWTFRAMIGAGTLMLLIALAGLWLARRRKLEGAKWFNRLAIVGIFLPIIANWSGWIFTEMGRQPWVVYGLLKTSDARSPNVSLTEIVISLTAYIVVYVILIAVGARLMFREVQHGPEEPPAPTPAGGPPAGEAPSLENDLVMAY